MGLPETPASRIAELVERLRAFYGVLPFPPASPFALYLWEVLSVGTSPARRDAAFNAFKRIPALTAHAVARVPQAKLERAVALAGSLRDERLRAIRSGVDRFRRDPGLSDALAGTLRQALRAARRVPHLGRASGLRLVLFAGRHPIVPLDEAALRVATRLGYGVSSGPQMRRLRSARRTLAGELGENLQLTRTATLYLAHHGTATCLETAPRCAVCPLLAECAYARVAFGVRLN